MPVTWRQTIEASAGAGGDSSPWIPFDIFESPMNVGFGVTTSNDNGVVFRVEHTFDDVLTGVSAVPFTHADVSAAQLKVDGNYAFGIRATRLTVVSVSASANLVFRGIQTGSRGT